MCTPQALLSKSLFLKDTEHTKYDTYDQMTGIQYQTKISTTTCIGNPTSERLQTLSYKGEGHLSRWLKFPFSVDR